MIHLPLKSNRSIRQVLLLLSLWLFASGSNAAHQLGDLAPREAPDGQLNVSDLLILQRIVLGKITATPEELIIGDVAPLSVPDGELNVGDLLILQRAILGDVTLGTIDVVNQLNGTWVGQCIDLGSGEYQQEIITFIDGLYLQEYVNSGNAGCSSPWIKVSKSYSFSITDQQNITTVGASLDLLLNTVTVIPYEQAVVDLLNSVCNKNDFVINNNNASGVQCQGNVQYPVNGAMHYELIRQVDSNITLGDKLDVDVVINRASQLSNTRIFLQTGSGQ